MRVLHLIPSLAGGGAERQITYLLGGLRGMGCDAHLGLFWGGANLGRAEASGAELHWIAKSGRRDALLVPRTIRLIRSLRPDVVQTWLTQMDVVGGLASIVTRTPWILSERTSDQHNPGGAKHRFRGVLGRHADAVIANSIGGSIVWSRSSVRRFVIPNGLPLDEIDAAGCDDSDYGGSPVILFVGRFDQEKNLPNLLAALGEVMARRDAIALLCGMGPLEGEVRKWIDDGGWARRIRMLGFTDRIWSLMKRADLLVAVSWYEGQPNAVIEAAACGCPLVLSAIRAHSDCFDESAALFASPDDPHAIAGQMLNVLDDSEAAHARAIRAKQIAGQWSIERASAAYLQVYEQVTATPVARRSTVAC
jgi:glycosyltransferase involved in cell wall biosynthesis